MENHVALNFREKKGLGIILGVGFKQVWGICSLFYESSFVFVNSFSCDLLKRKKKKNSKRRKKKEKLETIKEKEEKWEYKSKRSRRKRFVQIKKEEEKKIKNKILPPEIVSGGKE